MALAHCARLWNMRTHDAWAVIARTQETHGEVEGQQYNHTGSSTKNRPITHHGASQSRATQVGFQPRHCGGITIDPTLTI